MTNADEHKPAFGFRITGPVVWPSLVLGLLIFVLDRGQKFLQLETYGWRVTCPPPETNPFCPNVEVTDFFSYVLVWNPGISYGLLQNVPVFVIAIVMIIASGVLAWWWSTAETTLTRFGLAICLGGALSHLIDRLVYGAVPDFFYLHWREWSFYVFNISDAAITLGVIFLLVDMVLPQRKAPA